MTHGFTARILAVLRDEASQTEVLALGEEPDGGGRSIQIQRSLLEPDEQDVALGQDTYCLVLESGATFYGGVERWALEGRELVLVLSAEAQSALSIRSPISIQHGPQVDTEALEAGLRRLLAAA